MKEINMIFEIKQLHIAIGKFLFGIHPNHYPSPLQMEILEILIRREGEDIFLKDIQEELNISKAAVSDTIDKMEKKGFLTKQAWDFDGRKSKLLLLDEGKNAFRELEKNVTLANKEILKGLSQEELFEFVRISHVIQDNLKKEGIE